MVGKPGPKKSRISETQFQTWLIRQLKLAGATIFNIHGHSMQQPGWPDIQVYHRIWTGHIELKVRNEKPTNLQAERMRNLRERGTNARWITCHGDGRLMESGITALPIRRIGPSQEVGLIILNWLKVHVEGPIRP